MAETNDQPTAPAGIPRVRSNTERFTAMVL